MPAFSKRERNTMAVLCLLPLLVLLVFPARQFLHAKRTRDLGEAIKRGSSSIRQLITAGADINGKMPDGKVFIDYAAEENNRDVVLLLMDAGAKASPLVEKRMDEWLRFDFLRAVHMGDVLTISRLLRAGIDADFPARTDGSTFLMVAAREGKATIIRQLLTAGANPNARNNRGDSVLWHALSQGDRGGATARILLSAGARPTPNDRLLMAIHAVNVEQARAALMSGANPNARDTDGCPLLSLSAIDIGLVRLLLAAGADARAKGFSGETVLTIARRNGNGVHTNCKANPQALLFIESAANKHRETARS